MPESDLEMMAMLSRAAERVGLEWRKPPCPEPSRLDDWFLKLACAGSQRPAPGASLPEVHEELTLSGAVSCDTSVSLYLLHPAGQTVPPLPGL